MRAFFSQQIREIQNDPLLQWTGLGLAACHLLTLYSWWDWGSFNLLVAGHPGAVCHAFFLSCLEILSFTPLTVKLLGGFYLVTSLLAVIGYLTKRSPRFTYFFLLLATLIKIFFFASRYNIMGNYHLMHFILSFVFLLYPQKRHSYALFLVAIYFAAGLIKVDPEWLSGAALIREPVLSGKWLLLSLTYVVTLEVVLVWGLLSKRVWLQSVTLFQLVVFHIFSWHIVGYFYPLTMFFLLLPLALNLLPSFHREFEFNRFPPVSLASFVLLLSFNLYPTFAGFDPALDGTARSLRFNMLDSRPACHAVALLKSSNAVVMPELIRLSALRTTCDPTVFDSQLREYCKVKDADQKIHFILQARRTTDSSYTLIRDQKEYCHDARL